MRKSNESTLKDAISEFLESKQMKGKLSEINIINGWEKLVGSLIAKNTSKIYFKNSKMFLHIDSAPLRTELNYQKSKLVDMVNKEAGEELITDVVVR